MKPPTKHITIAPTAAISPIENGRAEMLALLFLEEVDDEDESEEELESEDEPEEPEELELSEVATALAETEETTAEQELAAAEVLCKEASPSQSQALECSPLSW